MPRGQKLSADEAAQRDAEKKAKFVELAQKRVPAALEAIRKIENLTSSNYSFTPDQVNKILATLRGAVDGLEQAFKGSKKDGGFTL